MAIWIIFFLTNNKSLIFFFKFIFLKVVIDKNPYTSKSREQPFTGGRTGGLSNDSSRSVWSRSRGFDTSSLFTTGYKSIGWKMDSVISKLFTIVSIYLRWHKQKLNLELRSRWKVHTLQVDLLFLIENKVTISLKHINRR